MNNETTIRFDNTSFVGEFTRRMVALRNEVGLSQHALSKRAGIPRSTIAMIESGRQSPTFVQVGRIASAMGVSSVELIGF